MNVSISSESGFTLVELLIITGTLSLLLMLSINSYGIYKESAYNSTLDHSVHHIESAMQAGLIDNDFSDGFGFAWVNLVSAGQPSTQLGRDLLPGYMHPRDTNVWVSYDGWCATGVLGDGCVEMSISGRHCQGSKWIMEQQIHNGTRLSFEWAAAGGC